MEQGQTNSNDIWVTQTQIFTLDERLFKEHIETASVHYITCTNLHLGRLRAIEVRS